MKCNLTKLVKCIIIVTTSIVAINIVIFLKSPQALADNVYDKPYRPELTKPGNGKAATRPEPRPTSAPVSLESTTTCPGLKMISPHPAGTFQVISGKNIYIYSVFLDGNQAKIIALVERWEQRMSLTCQMWFHVKNSEPLFITAATTESLPEDHGRRYIASFINCEIPGNVMKDSLYAVSVVPGPPCDAPNNILLLPGQVQMDLKFAVCVTPINYRYSRAYELVEMIELNKLLGAQKIVFYNHTTGPNVDKVLELYSQRNEVDVLQWHLPMNTDTWPPTVEPEIHYFAQMAALNDCLYRYKNRSHYLVYQDLDEFIIPKNHDTWGDLLHERESITGIKSSYQFKCVFFRKEWPRPAKQLEDVAKIYKSVLLTYTIRESEYLTYNIRSKYIVNPRLVTQVGVHQVWVSSYSTDMISEQDGSLHHYRSWEKPDDNVLRVVDESAVNKYGSRLADRLQEVWSKLEGVPMDINISSYGHHV